MYLKNYPECFPSLRHYLQWVKAGLAAKEAASPCDDCSAKFQDDMTAKKRCYPNTVRTTFAISGRTPIPAKS